MHLRTKKPQATRQTTTAKSPTPVRSLVARNREVQSHLYLQRVAGNQPTLQSRHAATEEHDVEPGADVSTAFAHDFSRIPVHAGVSQRPHSEEEMLSGQFTPGETAKPTGIPRPLKTRFEALSGMNLSDVRVHYNSPKPAQFDAMAYTQGHDIFVSPGQERQLPHEGWHAVQQLQGRVQPTMQGNGESLNDDMHLEREAELMGTKALPAMPFTRDSGSQNVAASFTAPSVAHDAGRVIQLAPNKQKWGGRGGSKWAPLPWTHDELKRLKAADLRDASTEKDRRLLEQKYFIGEQVIKNWDNRYGNWHEPVTDPWARWFQVHMKDFGRFSYYPDKLWRAFLSKRAESAGLLHREVFINPFGPGADAMRYELYKDELECRDPTSFEFYKSYSKYIDPQNPHARVDPPKDAQTFMKDSSYTKPMSNSELRKEIARLRKVLKLDK
jgi:hypothetical protein